MKKTIIVKNINTSLVDTTFTWEGDVNFFYNPAYVGVNKKKPIKCAWHRSSWNLSIKTIYKELSGATKTNIEQGIARLSSFESKPFHSTNSILFDFAEQEITFGKGQLTVGGDYEIKCTEEIIQKLLQLRLEFYSGIGGTSMFCPSCEKVRSCESVNYEEFSKGKFRRFYSSEVDKVHWFARARKCRTCFYVFETVEVSRKILSEFLLMKKKIIETQEAVEQLSDTGNVIKLKRPTKKILLVRKMDTPNNT
jgi:hypothetical protein